MKNQKMWNFFGFAAVTFLAIGYFLGRSNIDIIGKCFIIFGALLLITSIVGSSYTYEKHPYKCPICGSVIKPTGRWLPGLGFNGLNIVVCTSCGATIHIQDLEEK